MGPSPISRRGFAFGTVATAAGLAMRRARSASAPIRVGLLVDVNGPYAEVSGPGAVAAVRAAVEDSNKAFPGLNAEALIGDMGTNADLALSLTRGWFDNDGVAMVTGVPSSAAALALTGLVRDKNRVAMITDAGTSELTSVACGPNHVHWTWDTYSATVPVVNRLLGEGKDTWFFIAPDYALGTAMVNDATAAIKAGGGKVVGLVKHPFPGTADFSSYLLQAQNSQAKVVCITSAGADVQNTVKQAGEFGLTGKVAISAPLLEIADMAALGQAACEGLTTATCYYWDRNAASRAFADRLRPVLHGQPPVQNHLGIYTATMHFLKVAAAMGPAAPVLDGRAMMHGIKATAIEDAVLGRGYVRADGRAIHEVLVLEGKAPSASKGKFDIMNVAEIVPGDKAFRPMLEACKALGS